MNIRILKKVIYNTVYAVFASVLIAPVYVYGKGANGTRPAITGDLPNPLGPNTTLWTFINDILGLTIKIGFPIVVLAIVYSGFLFVTAQGNEKDLPKAKQAFMWTVIGAIVLLGAQAISFAIKGTIEELQ